MTAPRTQSWGSTVGRVFAGIVSAGAGLLWVLCAFVVVTSGFSAAGDPHGFGLIFGTLLAAVTGLVFAVTIPFAFARRLRAHVGRIAMATYVVVTVLLFAVWFFA